MPRELIRHFDTNLGSDPEVFVTYEAGKVRKRKVAVGSEMLIPKDGVRVNTDSIWGKLVRDGVQVEFNTYHGYCRESVSYGIGYGMAKLQALVEEASKKLEQDLKIDFTQVIKLSKGDLEKLSPDSRRLGCLPSLNVYGRKFIEKDGTKYLYRSAAGHLHMGSTMFKHVSTQKGCVEAEDFIRLCDLLVGNTAVLIDRDKNAPLRRKTYGRAGEYRLPKHGVEYRTLSNFWLRDYKLMHLMMGMFRLATVVAADEFAFKLRTDGPYGLPEYKNAKLYWQGDAATTLLNGVDFKLVEQAINENDWELAKSNFDNWVRPFIADLRTGNTGLDHSTLADFDFFVGKIREAELGGNEDPLSVWFKDGAVKSWKKRVSQQTVGSESWLSHTVRDARRKESGAKLEDSKMKGVVSVPVGEVMPTIDPSTIFNPNVGQFQGGILNNPF
jgi:hypothetical protein